MSSAELTWRATAEANLLSARQRHGNRLGSKKSRNGCSVCRARRVKCDEARPQCQRCRDGSRECSYDPSPPSKATKDVTPSISPSLPQLMRLRDKDRRTFDYFISYTAPRLAGAWDKEFWCSNVLQLAQHEPFVLDSLLAISVLYEHPQYMASFNGKPGHAPDQDNPGTSFEAPTPLDDHHLHALKLYSRAIRSLSAQIAEGKASHAVALLSCVLFICIETIRDDVFAAMTLFMQGTNMLKRIERTKLASKDTSMLVLVEYIFERMAVQAVLYGHPSGPSLRHDLKSNGHAQLGTLAEARSSLFSLVVGSHSFLQQADAYRHASIDAKLDYVGDESSYLHGLEMFGITRDPQSIFDVTPDKTDHESLLEERGTFSALQSFYDRLGHDSNTNVMWQPQDLLSQRQELLRRLDQWNEHLRLLLKRTENEPPQAISYLRLCYLASKIWIGTRLETTEIAFDGYTAQFRELLRHAEVYVRSTAHPMPIFTFEIGALLPLFLIASKCRVPSVRRQALDLMLQCPKKESHFGAYSSAQTICRLIAIEERGSGLAPPDLTGRSGMRAVDDGVIIPEDSRVHSFDLLKNRKLQNFEMRATRYCTIDGRLQRVVEDFPI